MALARNFGFGSQQNGTNRPRYSRIGFHPDFSRNQSVSSGVDNLAISFTCLSYLMDVLGVRDENDYEKLISTEVVSDRGRMLQVLGTVDIKEDDVDSGLSDMNQRKCKASSASSFNVDRRRSMYENSTISISVGTAPLDSIIREDVRGNVLVFLRTHRSFKATTFD